MNREKGFTLVEVCVVIVIMGILAVMAVTRYSSFVEKGAERQAFTNLEMIIAASEIYRMNVGSYYTTNNTADINTNLKTALLTTASRQWDYRITAGAAGAPPACVTAVRVKSGVATTPCWRLCTNTTTPASVTCP